jgi:hypothetical protein
MGFVAHNSHATYFTTGFYDQDRADGGALGGGIVPRVEDVTNYATTTWLFWPGHWGGSTGTGFEAQTSPTGPGVKGPQWDDPRAWQTTASGCSIPTFRSLHATRNRTHASKAATVHVPAPRVSARRLVGRRARVTYCFADLPLSPMRRPAFVEVSLQSANKRIPPYTVRYTAHLPCGRVTQAIGRGSGPFHALVSAWTRSGYGSKVVKARLR